MATTEKNTVTLVVYYNATQPIATLILDKEDEYLAWLVDSLDVVPCGNYYCLRLTCAQEFRQARRIFPAIGFTSRHVRFRGVLRKAAQKRISPSAAPEERTVVFQEQPTTFAVKLAAFTGLRFDWIKSVFKTSLTGI
ncbi:MULTISPECIES: hypothetical protein [Rufibacter]|uniref:Uncharacterized protein n=1 Tax=Rufibacter quisquiliarum TaxID=1549639 RepID=A0A839GTP9_9BACT|nr:MULTISPECIES: hypothetical protein [Rufibacter]MBA9078186.1 hypothetical protein [Rufibacter quisquiliarum]